MQQKQGRLYMGVDLEEIQLLLSIIQKKSLQEMTLEVDAASQDLRLL